MEKKNVDINEVRQLIEKVEKTRSYERQEIIDYHHQIFNEEDNPKDDNSCLRMKMMQIKAWYQDEMSHSR